MESIELECMQEVVRENFFNKEILYSLSDDDIRNNFSLYNIEIIKIFNNRTWEDVLNDFDYLEINQLIDDCYYSLKPPALFFHKKIKSNINLDSDNFYTEFIFNYTGLFYIGSLMEANENREGGNYVYTICRFLDPDGSDYQCFPGVITLEGRDRFSSLISLYTDSQLFLLAKLFLYLCNFTDVSSIGIKYWSFIYNNLKEL